MMIKDRAMDIKQAMLVSLAQQGITNFYFSYDNGVHSFHTQSRDEPIFETARSMDIDLLFWQWCDSTPNEDIDIAVAPCVPFAERG